MKNKIILSIILSIASAGLAVLAFFILPEKVVIQFSVGSSGNTAVPKLLAILIPTALGIGGAVASIFYKENEKLFKKSLLVSAIGIGLAVITMVINSFIR